MQEFKPGDIVVLSDELAKQFCKFGEILNVADVEYSRPSVFTVDPIFANQINGVEVGVMKIPAKHLRRMSEQDHEEYTWIKLQQPDREDDADDYT